MAVLKWIFMIFTFAHGFMNKGGGPSFDLLPILEKAGDSFDRALRRAVGALLLAGLAGSLMVAGIVLSIVTGVFLANGTAAPELVGLMYAGLGIIAAALLLGLAAVVVARGKASPRQTYQAPFAQAGPQQRAGGPLEEAVAALVMDFVRNRQQARTESEPRAQRQNTEPRDSEFANREFMN